MPDQFEETLRFPSNLDRAGIESRLVDVRKAALAEGLPDLAAMLENLPALTAAHLGAKVVAALNLMQEKPEHRKIATQLEIVAMNLKNLK
jgi:hypothetical protein